MKFKHYFKLRYIKFNLIFVLLAVLIGLVSVFFVKVVELAFKIFLYLEPLLGWWLVIYIPLMMMGIVYLLRRFFPEAEGSGMPQALAISHLDKPQMDKIFMLRAIFSKILLIFLGTLCGGTLGREGATVQIGASLMNLLGKNLSLQRRKVMLIVGAASGLASAFNTPLGGIVFAFEELVKSRRLNFSLLKMAAIAISGIVSIALLSNYSYFGRVERELLYFKDDIFIAAIVIGVVAGGISVIFARIVRLFMLDKSPLVAWRKNNPYKNALYCGVIVAVVGMLSHGLSFGNGYHESKMALSGEIVLPPSYVFYKLVSALFTTNSGIPGGYFATSLAIGNGIGGLVHSIWSIANPQQYYLLGMVAFLASLTRAPATAIMMVIQVSSSQIFSLPLIVAALVATLFANLFGNGIYEYQISKYVKS